MDSTRRDAAMDPVETQKVLYKMEFLELEPGPEVSRAGSDYYSVCTIKNMLLDLNL